MLSRKANLLVLCLMAALFCGAHFTKERLASLKPQEGFKELLYLPSGHALKLMSCGFDAVVADLLWVRGLVYYSENIRASKRHNSGARYRYVYQLHDSITDLQPDFYRAYLWGSMFLTSRKDPELAKQSIRLLQKGATRIKAVRARGVVLKEDPLWRFYVYMANTYESQFHDYEKMLTAYEKAIEQPNCPDTIKLSYAAFRIQREEGQALQGRYLTMMRVWEDMLQRLDRQGETKSPLRSSLLQRLQSLQIKHRQAAGTAELESFLTQVVRRFRANYKRLPQSISELIQSKTLRAFPALPYSYQNDYNNARDHLLILPDGSVRSYILARLNTDVRLQQLHLALKTYYQQNNKTMPPSLEVLTETGVLKDAPPKHPLAALGHRLIYNPQKGPLSFYDSELEEELPMGSRKIPPPPSVRVAAIQFVSSFGKPFENQARLKPLIANAARLGAEIVVLPEACLPGYGDITHEVYWTDRPGPVGRRPVQHVAEPQNGPTVQSMAKLADRLNIYLTVPFIEVERDRYYLAVSLVDPEGQVILHHRKHTLWDVADSDFATPGPADPPVVDTRFGRIGCMICRDMHSLPAKFAEKKVDLVLHSAGFYGPGFEVYLRANKFTRKFREPGMHLVIANHSVETEPWWQGYGMSRILRSDGKLMARTEKDLGNAIVFAELPLRRRTKKTKP